MLKIVFSLLILLLLSATPTLAQESGAEFRLDPSSGWIKHEQNYTIDVLIDTKGESVTLARAVLTFDPSLIQIIRAQFNDELFCDWPENQQVIDNERGMVVATGFCNSPFYTTQEEADVFVRLTIEPLKENNLTIFWEFSGRDEPFKTAIVKDGSPPQNILLSEPNVGNYVISLTEPTGITPDAGIFEYSSFTLTLFVGSGILLMGVGAYIFFNPSRKYFNNSRTKVVYGDKED